MTDEDGEFVLFMSAYPRRTSRPKARTQWLLHVRHAKVPNHAKVPGKAIDAQRVLAGLDRWSAWWEAHDLLPPHAATFLANEQWRERPTR
jgi:hypothetical protein